MSVRLLLTDEAWAEIAPLLATLKSRARSPPALSDRMCIEAVRYLARPGTPGRDLPEDFGPWDAVYHRFRRWERRPAADCSLARHIFIDATLVCAHQHAAGALKKRRTSRPGSGPLSRRLVPHNPCRRSRCPARRRVRPPRRPLS